MQHFEKFVFFEPKNVLFVGKKLDFFPKTRKVANLLYNAYQMILYLKKFFSALIVRFFARNQKVCEVGEIREYDEETVYFQKKNALIFLKAFSTKMGRRKICRWQLAVLFRFAKL